MSVEDDVLRLKVSKVFQPLENAKCKYKGARGGRGSGKSHYFAEKLVRRALEDPKLRAVCVREIQKSLKDSSKRLIQDKIEALGVSDAFEILDTEIHILDDYGRRAGIIIFTGMQNHTAGSIKSLEGYKIAWIEEAQSITRRSWELLYPTIRNSEAEIWASWNPDTIEDPIEEFFYQFKEKDEFGNPTGKVVQVSDPDILCITANYSDNPYFYSDTSLAADMERDKSRDPSKYAHIWLGAYRSRSDAAVFNNWDILDFGTPTNVERFYYGSDWGFSVDPSVLVRCFIGRLDHGVAVYDNRGRHLFVDYEAWRINCEMDDIPALFAGTCPSKWTNENGAPLWYNRFNYRGIPGALDWPITGDSARPETISYMQKRRFKINAAQKGPSSVEDGIEFLKNFDIHVHPRCVHVIDELAKYQYKVDDKTDEVLPILEDKANHTIDSLRYAVEGMRRGLKLSINPQALRRL